MKCQVSPPRLGKCAPSSPIIGGQCCPIRDIVPSCTICAALARSGARPTCVCAKRDKRVGFALRRVRRALLSAHPKSRPLTGDDIGWGGTYCLPAQVRRRGRITELQALRCSVTFTGSTSLSASGASDCRRAGGPFLLPPSKRHS